MHKLQAMAPLLAILGVVAVLLVSAPAAQAVTVEVKTEQKISDTEGGFMGVLDDFDFFGTSVANLGDLDGDGITDLAVGTFRDDDNGDCPGLLALVASANCRSSSDKVSSASAGTKLVTVSKKSAALRSHPVGGSTGSIRRWSARRSLPVSPEQFSPIRAVHFGMLRPP